MINIYQELLSKFNKKMSTPKDKPNTTNIDTRYGAEMGTIIGRTEVAVTQKIRIKLIIRDSFKINYKKLA